MAEAPPPGWVLQPIPGEDEVLRDDCTTRPMIAVTNQPLTLGRGSLSMISDPRLARKAARIEAVDGSMTVRPLSSSLIEIDGQSIQGPTRLDIGQVLRLSGRYAYRVETNPVAAAAASSSSPRKRRAILPPLAEEEAPAVSQEATAAAEEFYCDICLDIVVAAKLLVPCGHSFCSDCITTKTCPTCRAPVQQTVGNIGLDQAVAGVVELANFFPSDDLEAYRERTNGRPGSRRRRSRRPAPAATRPNHVICID